MTSTNVSEFRRKKLMHVFDVIFDFNRSGTIEEKDFEIAVVKITAMRGWDDDHPKCKETRDTLFAIWDGLKNRADSNRDNSVSADEWCQMWANASDGSNDWQNRYREFMFDLEDTSGDGAIDEEEFVKVFTSFSLAEDDVRSAFRTFSQNNQVTITRDVFNTLWDEYFNTEDPNAHGNFIFGKSKFD